MREQTPATAAARACAGAMLATGTAVPAGTATGLGTGSALTGGRLRRQARGRLGADPGAVALGAILLVTLAVVVEAAAGPSDLVPRSATVFPAWEAGPLHAIVPRLLVARFSLQDPLTGALAVLLVAYLVVLRRVRTLSTRAIVVTVVLVHALFLLSPPMQLTDMFNYLGYARLGTLHHLNPYTHPIASESFDPVFTLSSWHGLRSPYGELFTIVSYPLGLMGLAAAYWVVKTVTVVLSLGFVWLVWLGAQRLGRDPREAVAFVALNPIFIVYALGGFHNDFLMLVPATAAITFVLAGRDRSAGASLIVAVAVKFTAVILGPFLLVALATGARRRRFVAGALIALVPLLAASLLLFGTSLPNLQQQSRLLTPFSVPNLVGFVFGVGGSPLVLRIAECLLVAVIVYQLLARRDRWLAGAGWSTVALVLSLSWVVPWYVVWVLPLAVFSASVGLRRACLVLTVFLLFAFAPLTTSLMNGNDNPLLHTPAGRSSLALQHRLSY